jgi:RNA polymerase sigma-70 factor (ECF subfamily)
MGNDVISPKILRRDSREESRSRSSSINSVASRSLELSFMPVDESTLTLTRWKIHRGQHNFNVSSIISSPQARHVEEESNFLYVQSSRRGKDYTALAAIMTHSRVHRILHKEEGTRTDGQLIRAATRGDKAAFSALVRRYEDTVYKFSYKVCRDKDKAAEALQDTFINVYRKLDSFDGKSKFSTWLYSIVTNNCLMKRRKRKMDDLLESLDDPPTNLDSTFPGHIAKWEETPADILIKKELRTKLDQAILKLPVDYRIVFVLRDLEGKSNEETASILKLSVEATKSRLRRARAFLRSELSPYISSASGVN